MFFRKSGLFQVDAAAFLWLAFLLLTVPANWLLAAVFAAGFHELCHILSLRLFRGRIRRVHVHWNGCVMEAEAMDAKSQFLSILAGPLGSLSLVLLGSATPKIAVCGLIQGLFNLIPLRNLDGGRLLREILCFLCPDKVEAILEGTEILLRLAVSCLILLITHFRLLNPVPGFLLTIWNIRATVRKFPCKPKKIRVQ